MVSLLRGAQSGDAEAFTCLYAVTNPLLVRYLRVVSDADPAALAMATWSSLLAGISAIAVDEDDDWLELAVSTAREQALAATGFGAFADSEPEPDQVEEAIGALRACGSDVAEVLAMGVVAGLGRDSIARITGREPTAVLALVLAAEAQLGRPPATLSATFQVAATPDEVRDLPVVLPLFTAQAHEPRPAVTTASARPALTLLTRSATAAASAGGASVVTSAGSAFAGAARRPSKVVGVSPRVARVGAGAAAWTVAVGGVAAAAALIGVAPAAFDSLFGNGGAASQGIVAAHGPTRFGGVPSFAPGGGGTTTPAPGQQVGPSGQPGQPGRQPAPQGPGVAGAGIGGPTATPSTGEPVVSASTAGLTGGTQVVVVSAVLTSPVPPTGPAATPAAPATPPAPGGIPTSPTPSPPSSTTGSGTTVLASAVKAAGTAHPKHSTGLAKGGTKASKATKAAKPKASKPKPKAPKAPRAPKA